jgi:hypothetical protein
MDTIAVSFKRKMFMKLTTEVPNLTVKHQLSLKILTVDKRASLFFGSNNRIKKS